MAKTVQLLAVAGTVKEETDAKMNQLQHVAGQAGLFEGHLRTYEPAEDGGIRLPEENKKVRVTAAEVLTAAQQLLTRQWDLARTLDEANSRGRADVKVDGQVLLADVPVGHLLWLAREIARLHKLVEALPAVDVARDWSTDGMEAGLRRANPVTTTLKEKIPGKFVLYDATKEHPAQVQRLDKDEVVGFWTQVNISGALERDRKEQLLRRLVKLSEAVRMAREEANTAVAEDYTEAKTVFDWLTA